MIHPTAVISPTAKIGNGVKIGPYTIVGDHVEIGDETVIGPHVVLTGHTRIGQGNRIFQFCSIGEEPQDKKYSGEPTRLEIGDRNTIHEYCSIHIGTVQDEGVTRIGSDNWIMGYVHIAHDCLVGSHTIFASGAQIAGHVHVGDWAIISGMAGVHQFVHIGEHCFIGGASVLVQDVPPFVSVSGYPAKPFGINSEGLRRRGFSSEVIMQIKRAYKVLYRQGLSLDDAKEQVKVLLEQTSELRPMYEFLEKEGRGIVR